MGWISARGTGSYPDDVQKLVQQIKANLVGGMVVGAIYRAPRDVVIRPLSAYQGPGAKQCRAVTDADDKASSS